VNPGYLRTPLEVMTPTEATDAYGQSTSTYAVVATVFAAVNEASADEKMNHRQMNQVITHRIRARWHPDITHKTRLRTVANTAGMSVTAWDVVSVINWQERREYMDIVCRQVIA
jgi:SPP1 family predicted phage head-tail adaptor